MRSKLFVPGSRPELFAKAMAGEADGLSFDLEDAVDEATQGRGAPRARAVPARAARQHGKTIIVRVNGLATPHFEADIEAIVGPGLDIVNLPKPESGRRRARRAPRRSTAPSAAMKAIPASASSPTSNRRARCASPRRSRGASPRVVGLQAGWGDLIEPLDIDRYNPAMIEAIQLRRSASPREKRASGPTTARSRTSRIPRATSARPRRAPPRLPRQERHPSHAGASRERRLPPDGRRDRPFAQGGRGRARSEGEGRGRLHRERPHGGRALHPPRRDHPRPGEAPGLIAADERGIE